MKNIYVKKYFAYIKIIITVLIFWILIHNSQLEPGLFYTLFDYPFTIVIIISLCFLMVFLHAWRWYRLNSVQNITLTYPQTIVLTYIGTAFSHILPGNMGGDFIRLYYIFKQFPTKKSGAMLAILVDRMTGLMSLLFIGCAILPYYLNTFSHNKIFFYVFITCVSLFIAGIIVFFVAVFLASRKNNVANWLEKNLFNARGSDFFIRFLEAIHVYKNAKLIILESLIISVMTQILLLIIIVMINSMMNLPMLSLFDFMASLVIGQIANLLPFTPGGIGVGEAVFGNMILLLNPGATSAYATVFFALRLLSTLTYLPGIVLGIFQFNVPRSMVESESVVRG